MKRFKFIPRINGPHQLPAPEQGQPAHELLGRGEVRPVPTALPGSFEAESLDAAIASLGITVVPSLPVRGYAFFRKPNGSERDGAGHRGMVLHQALSASGAVEAESFEQARLLLGVTPVPDYAAPAPVPPRITAKQFRDQLAADDKTETLDAAINAVADNAATVDGVPRRAALRNLFEYEVEYARGAALVVEMLGLAGYDTSAKVDDFFRSAAQR